MEQGEMRETFNKLYDDLYPELARSAFASTRDRETADEIVQEVFVKVFIHLNNLREPEMLGRYLRVALTNHLKSWGRQRQRDRSRRVQGDADAVIGSVPDSQPGPEDLILAGRRTREEVTVPPAFRVSFIGGQMHDKIRREVEAEDLQSVLDALADLLQQLSAEERFVLAMFILNAQKTATVVEQATGLSRQQVRSKLHRIRSRIKEVFDILR